MKRFQVQILGADSGSGQFEQAKIDFTEAHVRNVMELPAQIAGLAGMKYLHIVDSTVTSLGKHHVVTIEMKGDQHFVFIATEVL